VEGVEEEEEEEEEGGGREEQQLGVSTSMKMTCSET
jgi:hypothetical protein